LYKKNTGFQGFDRKKNKETSENRTDEPKQEESK